MTKKIFQLSDLIQDGKKIAFIDFNREIDEKQVKALQASFKELGECHTPLMMMEGEKVAAMGFKFNDESNGEDVTDQAKDYLVIVDGQHRFKAAQGLEDWQDMTKLPCFITDSKADLAQLLASVNNDCKKWSFSDFTGATAAVREDESGVLKFINDCAKDGFSPAVIGMILFQDSSKKLSKDKIAKVMAGEDLCKVMTSKQDKVAATYNLELAQLYVDNAKASPLADIKVKGKGAVIGSRYLADAVAVVAKTEGWKPAIEKIAKITAKNATAFKNASTDNKTQVLIDILMQK